MPRLLATAARLALAPALLAPVFLSPALLAEPALAEGAALVLGTSDYGTLDDLDRGIDVTGVTGGLAALGFAVSRSADGDAAAIGRAVDDFMGAVPGADRLVVVLSGRFATDGARTWYLTRDAGPPGILSLDRTAVSVESVLEVLSRQPSHALLLLGVDPDQDGSFDPWLREGVGDLDVPQGVTVLRAMPRAIAAFMADELAVPEGDLSRLVAANGAVAGEGYLPRGFAFMPAATPPATTTADLPPEASAAPEPGLSKEAALWQGAVALNTVEAYRNYLAAYPRGLHAAQAQQGIDAILSEPNREARLAEEALGLTQDQRRAIQRDLSLLDFDPRGIDGIFGPGTRGAIVNWQQQNGFAQTSYLTAEQVARLDAQATRRASRIEAEAERTRQAELAADQAYWEESGARGDEAGLRAYLGRYPDGAHADEASERLALIEEVARREAEAQDRAAWDAARRADTVRSYQTYLNGFPEGRFAPEAQARQAALAEEGGATAAAQEARAQEAALRLDQRTLQVVEQRLQGLGLLDAGKVDGTIDGPTRRALRGFQRDRDLSVTGFLNEATLVRLLAETAGIAGQGRP